MANLKRYNIEVYAVANGGDEVSELWIDSTRLVQIIQNLQPGDDLTIHRTEDAERGVLYP